MSDSGENALDRLKTLRDRIDAIDAEMHRLLIDRGTVIDELIGVKGTARPGAAFRPAREADMMRRLVARHQGALPLSTVEHIWREIITTFTRMQAPFDVVVDRSVEPERIRDVARFYFGFSVALKPVDGPAAVIAAVARSNDLGVIACDQPAAAGPWWRGLVADGAPRIMALLPFIGAKERPADLPAFVVSPPLADPTSPEIKFLSARAGDSLLRSGEAAVLARAGEDVLVAVPAATPSSAAVVGGISRGIAVDVASSLLYETAARKGAVQ
jgi:chorismate mutase-like protein